MKTSHRYRRAGGAWVRWVLIAILHLTASGSGRAAENGDAPPQNESYEVTGKDAPVFDAGTVTAAEKTVHLRTRCRLQENTRVVLPVRFGRSGEFHIWTGREKENIAVKARVGTAPRLTWSYTDPQGKRHTRWLTDFTIGGVAKANFTWTDAVLQWTDHYKALARPLSERWVEVALEMRRNRCYFLLDGVYVYGWPAAATAGGRPLAPVLRPGMSLQSARVESLPSDLGLHEPVDLAARFNAGAIDGHPLNDASLPVAGATVRVGGVPFVFSQRRGPNSHLDIGQSWFREGTLTSYEEPITGSFGGRWGGVFRCNPTRLQFRIPNRPYNAVYLLAAADGEEHAIPTLTVQFYRPSAGFPKSAVSPDVPLFTEKADGVASLPVRTAAGKEGRLWLVKIPFEPGMLQEFSDLEFLELELTKAVQPYRLYPDPCFYSTHAGGLPSAVRVFAMTMGIAPVEATFTPEALGNIWEEGQTPAYGVALRNRSGTSQQVVLELQTRSYDGAETHTLTQAITLQAGTEKKTRFELALKRFGHHDVTLTVRGAGGVQHHRRTLSHLRRRSRKARDFEAKGFMFGWWNWKGGHYTPKAEDEIHLMGMLGMEATSRGGLPQIAAKYGIKDYFAGPNSAPGGYSANPEKAVAGLEAQWKKFQAKQPPELWEPTYVHIYAEPGGIGTHGVLPEFYGEPPHMGEPEKARFQAMAAAALAGARVAKKLDPDVKVLLPWGDPVFAVPFLKADDELTKLIDGVAVDIGYFDRLPEMQMHQCAIHRFYQFKQTWEKFKKAPAVLPSVEGPCLAPVAVGALTEKQYAAHLLRASLILGAYGVNRQFSIAGVADCADYWGEQHYGSGLLSRINSLNPHVAYSAVGTLVRHLRTMEFVDWLPTGSLSTYCLRFRDTGNGRSLYVLWTVRGRREVHFTGTSGRGEVYDAMDNTTPLRAVDGTVTVAVGQLPVFVYGLGDTPKLTLGEPDHTDAILGEHTHRLGNASALWAQVANLPDPNYLDSFPEAIRRFPAEMKVAPAEAPQEVGGAALAVELPPQAKDRGVMPFYTTLAPKEPVPIPGKARHLSVWVKAASDWGRIVYVLRDALGETWTSVGAKGQWNMDDTPGASSFNFDGWRLVRFELPSNAPYDRYREMGTTWWGYSGGDGMADLPLALTKVYVERRAKAMYVNSLEPADPAPVEFGDLYAEYATAADMTEEAVKLDRLTMPLPPRTAKSTNPIADLNAKGTLPPTAITSVEQPDHYYDGTRGVFHFTEVAGATHYDIWLSLHRDGRGALKLGKKIRKTGALVQNFRANTEFHAFVVYTTNHWSL